MAIHLRHILSGPLSNGHSSPPRKDLESQSGSSLVTCLLIHLTLMTIIAVPAHASGRENKFCKQTKVSTIFNLGEVVYIQMMDGQWEWWQHGRSEAPLLCKQPRKERSLRQLFFLDLNPNHTDYSALIHEGFSGFLITTDQFAHFPSNVGLLHSHKRHYHMWIERVWNGTFTDSIHYRKWNGTPTVEMQNLLDYVRPHHARSFFYDDKRSQLLVAFANKDDDMYNVSIFSGNMNSHKCITKNIPKNTGHPWGFFQVADKLYFVSDKAFSILDLDKYTVSDGPPSTLGQGNKHANQYLLSMLSLFHCEYVSCTNKPEEFANLNLTIEWLNVAFAVVNVLLLAVLFYFCKCIKQNPNKRRKDQSDYNDRDARKRRYY